MLIEDPQECVPTTICGPLDRRNWSCTFSGAVMFPKFSIYFVKKINNNIDADLEKSHQNAKNA